MVGVIPEINQFLAGKISYLRLSGTSLQVELLCLVPQYASYISLTAVYTLEYISFREPFCFISRLLFIIALFVLMCIFLDFRLCHVINC